VDLTFGFSLWIVATETPVRAEITANVSPARTVQNRGPEGVVVDLLVVDLLVVVATVVPGADGTTTAVVVAPVVPERRPERISRIAIVAASRNAAGAAYRRGSRPGTTSRRRPRCRA
jgi:hypothetical protein